MSKTLLYRLFGLGRVPTAALPALEREGIVLKDEGVSGSITFKRFKAPGRRYSHKWSWFSGALVLTRARFVAFTLYPYFNPIIDIALDDDRLAGLDCSAPDGGTLRFAFDPGVFREGWSGSIECRYATDLARGFLAALRSD